jgi:hypothetical protein
MRKDRRNKIFLLLIYVDDRERIDLYELLMNRFGTVQYDVNNELSYLGMHIKVGAKSATIDMRRYVQNLIKDIPFKIEKSPGTKMSFKVDENSPKLEEPERKDFHSMTAKLLYLAKRARPDILTMVCFLCTRVQEATQDDNRKLNRVLGYLKGTADTCLKLGQLGRLQVEAYIDAAFACHPDSKSHWVNYIGGRIFGICSVKEAEMCNQKSNRGCASGSY